MRDAKASGFARLRGEREHDLNNVDVAAQRGLRSCSPAWQGQAGRRPLSPLSGAEAQPYLRISHRGESR